MRSSHELARRDNQLGGGLIVPHVVFGGWAPAAAGIQSLRDGATRVLSVVGTEDVLVEGRGADRLEFGPAHVVARFRCADPLEVRGGEQVVDEVLARECLRVTAGPWEWRHGPEGFVVSVPVAVTRFGASPGRGRRPAC